MLKKLHFKSWLLMLCMLLGVGNAWAQSDYSSDYTGNVELSTTGGTQTNTCKVVINDTNYSGIKAGTGKIAGAMKITVPSGTKYLHMHVAGWNGETVKLSVTPSGYSDVIALISNSGISNNSPFTFNGDANTSDYYKVITFNSPLTADTELTFTATTGKRFVVFGVSAENESATPTVAKPTFLPSGGTYAEAQNVTISCTTDGATILYSTDGNTWNTYSSAILVSQTTTIQAKANKEGMNESAVASASYIIEAPSTIADVREQGTGAVFTKGVVTSCVGVTGYIQDATAAICVYGANLTVGDEITVSGTLSTYKGLLEITNPNVKVLSQGNTVSPIVMTIAEINATNAPQGKYVKIVEAVVTAIDGQNTTIEQDGETIIVHGISSDVEYAVGDALTLEGNIGCFDVVQIANPQNVEVKKSEKQEAGLAYTTTEYTINLGESFATPTLTNPNNLVVTYTSSNEVVATVATDGAVTLVEGATGTTTITASFTGNDTYLPGSASYTLTIVDPNAPGTEDNPYTVAQVLELYANNNVPATEVYVKGTISRITSLNPPTYKNARYYISDDGTETNEFYVYNGKYLDGADFTSTDQIKVGDEVVIYGKLTSYSGTNEFAAGNYITSLSRPESTDPVINAENITLDYNATSGEIAYSIENVDEGAELDDATTTANWISSIEISADMVTFTTTENEGTEDRTATVTLSYGDVTKDVIVTQGHYVAPVVDYATLPFAFDGGRADIETTDGLTQDGLDSDYGSSPKLKFNSTGDVVTLHFNEQPGTLTYDIKGNSFSGSTFKVQTSADGVNYTDLKTYTTLGNTQSEIIEDIDADVRYIKWIYTNKASGNVALGNITLAKYTNKQDATVSFKQDGEVITTLEANLNAEIEIAVECNVEGAELSISSSNPRVAKYEDGVVKALSEGEATITATFAGNDNYKSATATLDVTVVDNRGDVELVFNDVPAEININETATYAVTATPTVEGVTYSSSAPTIVSVDESTGAIEALAVGTATITATFAGNNSYKAATATYTIKVVNPSFVASKYELITDASTLKAGDEIIIVDYNEDEGATKAISITQNTNNRAATSVEVASDGTITPSAEVAIITLGGETDAWTFYVTNGGTIGYLYAAGGSEKNYLRTQSDPADATITIATTGETTIAFNGVERNTLRYNPNGTNPPMFSCYKPDYTTNVSLVSIYRKVASSEFLQGDVNKDGSRTIADVTALVNIILGKATPQTNPEYNFDAADVNGDGGVPTIADVTALVNIILGKTN